MGSKMEPQGHAYIVLIGPWGVQDGLGVVLVRFSCRLVIQVCFFDPLELLLGSFWGAPGVVLGLWGPSWGSFRCLGCLHVMRPSVIDEVIVTRPCGLRAARLNSQGLVPSACQITDITSHQLIHRSTHQSSSIQPIDPSTHRFNSSTNQPINPSTHRFNSSTNQPINPSTHRFNSSTHQPINP